MSSPGREHRQGPGGGRELSVVMEQGEKGDESREFGRMGWTWTTGTSGPGGKMSRGGACGSWGTSWKAGSACSAPARCCHLGMSPGLCCTGEQDYVKSHVFWMLPSDLKTSGSLRRLNRDCAPGPTLGPQCWDLLQVFGQVDQGLGHLWAVLSTAVAISWSISSRAGPSPRDSPLRLLLHSWPRDLIQRRAQPEGKGRVFLKKPRIKGNKGIPFGT